MQKFRFIIIAINHNAIYENRQVNIHVKYELQTQINLESMNSEAFQSMKENFKYFVSS